MREIKVKHKHVLHQEWVLWFHFSDVHKIYGWQGSTITHTKNIIYKGHTLRFFLAISQLTLVNILLKRYYFSNDGLSY